MELVETRTGVVGFLAVGLTWLLISGKDELYIQNIFGSPNNVIWGFLTAINFVLWIAFLYLLYLIAIEKTKKTRKNKEYNAVIVTWAFLKFIALFFVSGYLAYYLSIILLIVLVYILNIFKLMIPKEFIGLTHFALWGLFLTLFLNICSRFVFKKKRKYPKNQGIS